MDTKWGDESGYVRVGVSEVISILLRRAGWLRPEGDGPFLRVDQPCFRGGWQVYLRCL